MNKNPYKNIVLLLPEPFTNAWDELVQLSQEITREKKIVETSDEWPLIALSIKSAHTTLSIATLIAMHQWTNALILMRSLFEIEILVKWLVQENTTERIKMYLEEISDEKERLNNKLKNGVSVSAQIMQKLYGQIKTGRGPKNKIRNKTSIRERARRVNMDRSYDIPYWVSSVFAHSHALSLTQWNSELQSEDFPFDNLFNIEANGFPCVMALQGAPMTALDTFQLVDSHFKLGFKNRIKKVRKLFNEASIKFSGGKHTHANNVKRGDVHIKYENGVEHIYSPKRTGNDPIDDD